MHSKYQTEAEVVARRVVVALEVIRAQRGITYAEIGRRVGICRSDVSKIFRGEFRAVPTLATLKAIADALEVNVELKLRRQVAQ